jgi:5'-nucleotidase (lipoprotein e(P4) family)
MQIKTVYSGFAPRVAITALVIVFAASSWVFAQESPAPAQYKAEEPANRSLDATLYVQTAAEYRASCYQAYNLATSRLDAKRKAEPPAKPFAVIMDLDETVLDNSPFQAMLLQNGLAWDKDLWAAWEEKHSGDVRAIPGAKEFIDQATDWGVEVFYVSNRNVKFKQQALEVLKALGLPLKDENHLKLADPSVPNSNDKTARFKQVRDGYTVLLYLGDNLRDFDDQLGFGNIKDVPDGELDGLIQARKAKVDNKAARDRLADDWIILPNPTYGEWKAPLGHGRSDFKRLAAAAFPIPSPTQSTTKCDWIILIPFLIIVLCIIWTLLHRPKEKETDAKTPSENQESHQDQQRAINEESRYLEGLLKDRFNFFLVWAPIFLFGVFKVNLSDAQRLLALAFGFIVFLLATLSILRTHLLIEHALDALDDTQAYKVISRKTNWLPRANFMLVGICLVVTVLMLLLFVTTWMGCPMKMGPPIP